MKICPKCDTGNNDNSIKCKDCGMVLNGTNTVEGSKIIGEFYVREEKKQKKKRIVRRSCLIFICVMYLVLYIRALPKGDFLTVTLAAVIFPVIGYLNIFHPKVLFILGHIFTIENLDDIELTDFYLISSMIGGIIIILSGIVFMLAMALS